MSEIKTLYIVGPTASGKTALSIELAKELNGEIICADSQTIRRDMNIGTAKPLAKEMQGIRHHMLDIIDPYDGYSLALFQKMAKKVISEIHSRNKPAIIVGGTGLYVDALYQNFTLPTLAKHLAGSNPATRSDPATGLDLASLSDEGLRERILEKGYDMPLNDKNRRHLENVLLREGRGGASSEPEPGAIIVGINPGRQVLIDRINSRVDKMFEAGFVDEVRSLIEKYGRPPKSFDAIGYKIVMRHIDGEISLEESKELFKIADRQYAKRQMAWFKRNQHIKWFEVPAEAKSYILSLC